MGSILLVVHLMVCIFLVACILMQRSTGGALDGLGGGSGASSFLSVRGTGNLLTRTTAVLATLLFVTSIALALYYRGQAKPQVSLVEKAAQQSQAAEEAPVVPTAE
ncbi:MAG: preprotein translocase subunit SecG [Alphaproteobacteria bacterium]|nr:preprotein translocase subunit SecG [Alphaproteobacteria bacterium]